ncbi:enoyl-CoA hydratase/isomerase family protein [Laribacter hongkongensis]|uniref:enoyl-CoA hydratase-related protein n=1 Tax=Laribacter hongkongensis TaxID=168471 RepID=UPI001EFD64B1|nr:enoyl-CoA hydratase-related protein [Laribacter hongkongensis]MCG9107011.1 enoyl-CoA hydratase/isomerase family protein [Laribacter hongkongensis]
MAEHLIVEHLGRSAILTLNAPPVNALDTGQLQALTRQIHALSSDPQTRALVLTGAGDSFFSAGADIEAFHAAQPQRAEALLNALNDTALALASFEGLTIAAINGYALGGGLALALACDVRIAERQAEVGMPEARLGLPLCGGTSWRLPQAVGEGWARRLAQTGELVSAARALQIGLVDELTDAGLAKIVAVSVADQGHFSSPGAARANRQLLRGGLDAMQAAQSKEMAATLSCLGSIEQVEGVLAFFEKRAPSWRDDNDA